MEKTAILVEMAVLWGGAIVIHRARGEDWLTIFKTTALRAGLASLVLLAILLTAADLGAGNVAALFGGLIVLGYLLAAIGDLGPALLSVEQAYLGGGSAPVTPPSITKGRPS